MSGENGIRGHLVEQPGEAAQPFEHRGTAGARQAEPVADGFLQLDHPVGEIADGVGDVQPQRRRTVAGRDEPVPLFEEQGFGSLLLAAGGEVLRRGRGAVGGGGAAGGQLGGQLGELLEQHADPQGRLGARAIVAGHRGRVRQLGLR